MLRVRQYWKTKIKRVKFSIGCFKIYGGWGYISLDKKNTQAFMISGIYPLGFWNPRLYLSYSQKENKKKRTNHSPSKAKAKAVQSPPSSSSRLAATAYYPSVHASRATSITLPHHQHHQYHPQHHQPPPPPPHPSASSAPTSQPSLSTTVEPSSPHYKV